MPDDDRIAAWIEGRSRSFEAGRAHDENLAYLLGGDYVPARGWELSRAVFRSVVAALAAVDEWLLVRAIVPLIERDAPVMDAIDPAAIDDQLDVLTPPMIVLMPPALAAYDERRFEIYEISLTLGDPSLPAPLAI